MNILKKYLEKIGVGNFSDLEDDEKTTYREWEMALSGKKLTDDDVAKFLVSLENELVDKLIVSVEDRNDIYLKVQLDLVRKIKGFLATPELQKKLTEQSLLNLVK